MIRTARAMALMLLVTATRAAGEGVFLQAQDSMFRTHVILNDRIVARALIDTGASYLSLCAPMAKDLGLDLGAIVQLVTSNGDIRTRRATIDSIRIGPIEIRSVAAVVKSESTPCAEMVVGMSVLQKLGSMTLKNGTLTMVGRESTKSVKARPARTMPRWNWK
jgi:clan AA aspartic protease (TIGR02281 family)